MHTHTDFISCLLTGSEVEWVGIQQPQFRVRFRRSAASYPGAASHVDLGRHSTLRLFASGPTTQALLASLSRLVAQANDPPSPQRRSRLDRSSGVSRSPRTGSGTGASWKKCRRTPAWQLAGDFIPTPWVSCPVLNFGASAIKRKLRRRTSINIRTLRVLAGSGGTLGSHSLDSGGPR